MPRKLSGLQRARQRVDLTWVEALSLVAFIGLLVAAIVTSIPTAPAPPSKSNPVVVLAAGR